MQESTAVVCCTRSHSAFVDCSQHYNIEKKLPYLSVRCCCLPFTLNNLLKTTGSTRSRPKGVYRSRLYPFCAPLLFTAHSTSTTTTTTSVRACPYDAVAYRLPLTLNSKNLLKTTGSTSSRPAGVYRSRLYPFCAPLLFTAHSTATTTSTTSVRASPYDAVAYRTLT
jgi:hypothetical protein